MTQVSPGNSPGTSPEISPQDRSARRVVDGLGLCDGGATAQTVSPKGAADDCHHTPLSVLHLKKSAYDRALDCVHCGLCLPACPTYTDNGLEADSPRGRIYLMKGLADGKIEPTPSVLNHLDACLDCRACETACPSGVVYHELLEETRAQLADYHKLSIVDRLVRWVMFNVFAYPVRLKAAVLSARLLQRIGLWKPVGKLIGKIPGTQSLDKMRQMLPTDGPLWPETLEPFYPAKNTDGIRRDGKKPRVAMFAGCVGSVLFQDVNLQAIALLQHAGCDVIVPQFQQCCGAIHHHEGQPDQAQRFARANIDEFVGQIDYIVNNIAGCGAMLKEYGELLKSDSHYSNKAQEFADKTRDISELLVELGLPELSESADEPGHQLDMTATYHDACHLAHAQGITDAPRQLLSGIPGLNLVPLFESDMCCGAAGTYNLTQPEMARRLAQRKIEHIQQTGARVCVTGNVGCAMQIQSEANRLDVDLHVKHPVSILHEAYFGQGQ